MFPNVLELVESIIAAAQSLLDELAHDELAQRHVDKLLNAAKFIRDEMTVYRLGDLINHVPRSASSYAATPFAIFKASTYILKKLASSERIMLSDSQIAQLEQMEINLIVLEKRLMQVWATEEPLW